MTARLRTAVAGVGYFCPVHPPPHKKNPALGLLPLPPPHPPKTEAVAREYGAQAFSDHRDLIGWAEAVSVAVPTSRHYEVARDLLEAGLHVLVEKPITAEVAEAAALNRLAAEKRLVLAVGPVG